MNTDEINQLIKVKLDMERFPRYMWSDMYANIYFQLEKACRIGCQHTYVFDDIDVHPEKTIQIVYCDQCYCTFHGEEAWLPPRVPNNDLILSQENQGEDEAKDDA